jgi:hypothetical protein
LFVVRPDTQSNPGLVGLDWLGLKTLAVTLESSSDAWNFHKDWWLPAAAEWMRIAGNELARVCASGKKSYPPGDLWKTEGGGKVCDKRRHIFWKAGASGEVCDIRRFRFWRTRLAEEGVLVPPLHEA